MLNNAYVIVPLLYEVCVVCTTQHPGLGDPMPATQYQDKPTQHAKPIQATVKVCLPLFLTRLRISPLMAHSPLDLRAPQSPREAPETEYWVTISQGVTIFEYRQRAWEKILDLCKGKLTLVNCPEHLEPQLSEFLKFVISQNI